MYFVKLHTKVGESWKCQLCWLTEAQLDQIDDDPDQYFVVIGSK